MTKDDRLYARFDIGMDEHPKIMRLSDAAFRAMFEATLYCRRQLTDGFLDEFVVLKMWGAEIAAELCVNHPERPSWTVVEGGWQIRDYAEHQTTRADIEAKRDAGRKGGLAKAKQAASKPVAPASEVLEQNSTAPLAITETETETETSKRVSATRGTRLSADWMPSNLLFDWAQGERSDLDVARQVEAFKDYWPAQPGQKGVKVDWDLTFKNWIRNARGVGIAKPSKDVRALTLIEQGRAMDERERKAVNA